MKITKTQLRRIIKEELSNILKEDIDIGSDAPYVSSEEVVQDKIQMRLDRIKLPEEREKVRNMIDQGGWSVEELASLSEGAQYILHVIRLGLSGEGWD